MCVCGVSREEIDVRYTIFHFKYWCTACIAVTCHVVFKFVALCGPLRIAYYNIHYVFRLWGHGRFHSRLSSILVTLSASTHTWSFFMLSILCVASGAKMEWISFVHGHWWRLRESVKSSQVFHVASMTLFEQACPDILDIVTILAMYWNGIIQNSPSLNIITVDPP